MARIVPVKMPTSSKALWFDANGIEPVQGDAVIVQTARGNEFGTVSSAPFDATEEQLASLKSPLKPVLRLASAEDAQKAAELRQRGLDIMPEYRELVAEEGLEMRPISVEFLFDGDKAVFYFEAEDRVDFRELVRKLASRFKVRVDMRQIGPRDEARMIGGLGHCGQELCCKRLGGEFCPVSIRMAKEQDLSLNPQKISGICGRLMCCLRYEYDAYKDFKGRAPKVGAKIETPDGEGKVISLDVPKETVTIQVEADKKICVPLADMSKKNKDGARPDAVSKEAWERASDKEEMAVFGDATFITSQFTSTDKLGEAKAVHREATGKKEKRAGQNKESGSLRSSRGKRGGNERDKTQDQAIPVRKPRRRSTKLAANGLDAASNAASDAMRGAGSAQDTLGVASSEVRRPHTRRSRGQVVLSSSGNQGARSNETRSAAQGGNTRDNTQNNDARTTAKSGERRHRRRSGKSASPAQEFTAAEAGHDAATPRPGRHSSGLSVYAESGNDASQQPQQPQQPQQRQQHKSSRHRSRGNSGAPASTSDVSNANAPAKNSGQSGGATDGRRQAHRYPRRRKSSSNAAASQQSGQNGGKGADASNDGSSAKGNTRKSSAGNSEKSE